MNNSMSFADVFEMTLSMFDLLEVKGSGNIKVLNNIITNLEVLYNALKEEESKNVGDKTEIDALEKNDSENAQH